MIQRGVIIWKGKMTKEGSGGMAEQGEKESEIRKKWGSCYSPKQLSVVSANPGL